MHRQPSLQWRFIIRVLTPPFVALLLLGAVVFWQLDKFVRQQAVNELDRSANATAAKLEREFALRQVVLKRTGEELFVIKSGYLADRQKLDQNRDGCSDFLKQKRTFKGAPNGVCDPFLAEFALQGATNQAIEDGYIKVGEELTQGQSENINDRLGAYKQFFPETVAILVVDDKQQVVSSALSEVFKGSLDEFLKDAAAAQQQAAEGKLLTVQDFRLAIFAYPINGGSVLAAYDLNSESFIKQTWESTPIDRGKAVAIILDANGEIAYPDLNLQNSLGNVNNDLRTKNYVGISLKKVDHIAVGTEAEVSKWLVVVASPRTVVLSPLRDAQLAAVVIIGTLLVGFLWVGTFFIQKTIRSILRLVSGALVFTTGKLDYKINLLDADQEFVSLANTMNKMAEQIAAAEKEIDEKNKEFISVATHELRTPLTGILGNLSMVLEDFGERIDATIKPMLQQVHVSTTRLRDLVNDMLDTARLEGGRAEFVIKPQNITAVAKTVIETQAITAKNNSVTLQYKEMPIPLVLADETKLRIVLGNFVSNAIKYNRPRGMVTVSHTIKDNMLITSVADTGLGIPDEQKAHMFEKFFRVTNQDRKNVVGTGLGMYITRQYILKMGGQVWFESTHGKGTTFYFSLPTVQPASPTPPNQAPAA